MSELVCPKCGNSSAKGGEFQVMKNFTHCWLVTDVQGSVIHLDGDSQDWGESDAEEFLMCLGRTQNGKCREEFDLPEGMTTK